MKQDLTALDHYRELFERHGDTGAMGIAVAVIEGLLGTADPTNYSSMRARAFLHAYNERYGR